MKLFLLFLVFVGAAQAFWADSDQLFKSFREGMKELEEASKKMEDMMAAESRLDDKSREEIEDMLREDNPEADASVSEDSDKKEVETMDEEDDNKDKKEKAGEDADEKDEDDDDDIDDFFGRPLPGGGIFNIFRFGGSASVPKPWYSGPNVCVTREEKVDNATGSVEKGGDRHEGFVVIGSAQFTSCKHSPRKYSCTTVTKNNGQTKTSTVVYECCHGFGRVPGKEGCQKVETKPALEIAADMGAKKFAGMVKSAGLEEKLDMENRTLFAPMDSGLDAYQNKLSAMNQIDDTQGSPTNKKAIETNDIMDMVNAKANREDEPSSASERDLVLNHIVPQIVDTSDFRNDLVLKTEAGGTLRINYFPGRRLPVVTVNCVRLNSTDGLSSSGMVHTVDGVLEPVTSTVQEILGRPEYSKFKALLEEHDLWKDISGEGPFTVLAVGNAAFDEFASKLENSACIKKVLKHHVLPHAVCSSAASSGRINALDSSDSWVSITLEPEEGSSKKKLVFDSEVASVEGKIDMMATNGLVHQVKSFVVPESAQTIPQVLKSSNATRMVTYLEKAGLIDEVTDTPKLTLFVPSEEFLEEQGDALDSMSQSELKELLRRHMATDPENQNGKKDEDCEVRGDGGLSLTSKTGQPLAVRPAKNVLSSFIGTAGKATVECVPLVRFNGKVCNGVMHEISGFIPKPNGTVYDIIQKRDDLKVLKRLLADTKLEGELKSSKAPVTFLAPLDRAFEKVSHRTFELLAADKDMTDQILRSHVIPEVICCSSIGTTSWPFTQSVRTLGSGRLEINGPRPTDHHHHHHHHHHGNDNNGRQEYQPPSAQFGGASTDECDLVATDGVLHTVNSVILPVDFRGNTELIIRRPNSDIILGGF